MQPRLENYLLAARLQPGAPCASCTASRAVVGQKAPQSRRRLAATRAARAALTSERGIDEHSGPCKATRPQGFVGTDRSIDRSWDPTHPTQQTHTHVETTATRPTSLEPCCNCADSLSSRLSRYGRVLRLADIGAWHHSVRKNR